MTSKYAYRKGSTFERAMATFLRRIDPNADRKVKTGRFDGGDITTPAYPVAWECKNQPNVPWGKAKLFSWVREAEAEAKNSNKDNWTLLFKREGYGQPEKQLVLIEMGWYAELLEAWGRQRATDSGIKGSSD